MSDPLRRRLNRDANRHLLILLVITILVRGWMFVSYPLGGTDDNQAAQRYLIDQLLDGNLQIGNLRYQTGYPLVIAPVVAAARPFGQFDDRIVLLVQVALSATIPFLIYDILRRRRTEREAFIVALVVLLDPFGLQWAHFWLPEWWIAFCLIAALWLIDYGLRRQRPILWTAVAGLLLGMAALARFNFAPVVALLGVCFFALSRLARRTRLLMFVTLGVTSVSILLLYFVLIQHPSTGTWEFSCISGINMIEGADNKGMTIRAENGPESAEYLNLMARQSAREILFLSDTYPSWRRPGSWATPEELSAFNADSVRNGYPMSSTNLIYFLGACPSDDLMQQTFFETVRAEPLRYVLGTLWVAGKILMQQPIVDTAHYMPTPDQLTPANSNNVLGFQRMTGWEYTGEWVWLPGITLFSALFQIWNASKLLTPLALVWALLRRDWWYGTVALLLIFSALLTAAVEAPEARIYSWLYPLPTILIGGTIAAGLHWWAVGRANRSTESN